MSNKTLSPISIHWRRGWLQRAVRLTVLPLLCATLYHGPESSFGVPSYRVPGRLVEQRYSRVLEPYFPERDMCKEGATQFCVKEAFARVGPNRAETPESLWRCYTPQSLETSGPTKVFCTDDCAQKIPCAGAVKIENATFATMNKIFERVLQSVDSKTCSESQKKINLFCASIGPGLVGRYSKSRSSTSVQWRCMDHRILRYDVESQCSGYCKKPIPCLGGLSDIPTEFDHSVYTRQDEITKVIDSAVDACPRKKCHEEADGPKCV